MTDLAQERDAVEALRLDCQDRAFNAYGTARIFEEKARLLGRRLKWLNFAGIAVPVVIGASALAWGAGFKLLPYMIAIAGVLGVFQIVGSVWSMTSNWVQRYTYAISSDVANQRLFRDYKALAEVPPSDLEQFRYQLRLITVADDAREEQDRQYGISDAEKRFGMRAGLQRFRNPCSSCQLVPVSMTPTNCEICGSFKLPKW